MKAVDKKRRMDGSKLLWHMDRVQARLDRKARVAPVHIDMGIAKFCNVSCVFCYGQYQEMKPVYIQREPLIQAMRDAGAIGVRSVGIIGDGEPTCNPHFYDALMAGKASGLDLSTSTNGALVDDSFKMTTILRACTWMRFCISAGTREGYQKIHGKDYFDKVCRNIRRMVEIRDTLGLKCEIGMQAVFVPTLMLQEMIDESKLAVDLGVDYLVIKQCSLPDTGESGMAQFDVHEYDKAEVQDALEQCESLSTDRTEIIPKWNVMAMKGQKPYRNCPSIALISEISGDGGWYPCGYMFGNKPEFAKYRFGNLHEKSLREIWESDHYWNIVSQMENEFNSQTQCRGSCRQDQCNIFCDDYRNPPKGINFV